MWTKLRKNILPIILLLVIVFFAGWFYLSSPTATSLPSTYRIARDQTWAPVQLYGMEGNISGFSDDLARAIAAEQHFSVEFVLVETDDLFSGLDQGDYDGVLSSSTRFEENPVEYSLSDPYYLLGPVLVTSTSSNIKSKNDLKGKTIGIITGSIPLTALEKHSSITFTFYDYNNLLQLLEDVSNNVIDGTVLDMMTAYVYTSGVYQGRLKILTNPLNNKGLCLIAKNDPESKALIQRFNVGLKAIKEKGIYQDLLNKWQLFNPERISKNSN